MASPSASTLSTRPPIERMHSIFQAIQRGAFPNRQNLATDLEVTVKTVQRDLDFMRDRMGLPIAYDRQHGGFHFTQEVTSFPLLELSEAEVVSVFVAQKALAAYRGTPFEAPLRSAYGKLIRSLDGRLSVQWSDFGNGVTFRGAPAADIEIVLFDALGRAVRESRVVRFRYRGLRDEKPTARLVEPYHLLCVQGQWYVVSFDRQRRDWRSFVLTRMRDLEVTGQVFTRDRGFDLNRHLAGSLGIFSGDGTHEVHLRFDRWSSQLIRERTWHGSQRLQEITGGRVELHLTLSSLEEIEPWVLSWGEHVEILAPRKLRQSLSRRAEKMLTAWSTAA